MKFEQDLIEGTLVRRYKRFLADVVLESGEEVTAHCANPGSMFGCSEPGSKVLLSLQSNPKRKFKHQLEIVYNGRTPIGVHTGRPNSIVAEAIMKGKIPEVAGYARMRREVAYGKNSRIDILLEGNGLRTCYIEVKNVSMARENVAYFPDAKTERGTKHLRELANIVREGNRAMVIFLAQRGDVRGFKPAEDIDPDFSEALRDASARGVEILCFRSRVSKKGIEFEKPIDLDIN